LGFADQDNPGAALGGSSQLVGPGDEFFDFTAMETNDWQLLLVNEPVQIFDHAVVVAA
jgi:hypothetical protein